MPARLRKLLVVAVIGFFLSALTPTAMAAVQKPTHLGSAKYVNWAGYQMKVSTPTSVRATWKVPSVRWQGRDGYSNQWVGLGGGTKDQGQLIQAGTETDNVCVSAGRGRCLKSRSSYSLWLETYPKSAQERVTNLSVSAGDTVDIKVEYRAKDSTALFTLCNMSQDACVTAERTSPAPRKVAEFVAERPSTASGRPLALAHFTPVKFEGMKISDAQRPQSLRPLPTTRMTMFNGHDLAKTGDLDVVKGSFTVAAQRAS